MFRHEEKFQRPTALGFLIEDTQDETAIKNAMLEINKLKFERVGQKLDVNLVIVHGKSGSSEKFKKCVDTVAGNTGLALVLLNNNPAQIKEAAGKYKDRKPLVGPCTAENLSDMAEAAITLSLPLIVSGDSLDGTAELIKKVNDRGIKDIVILPKAGGLSDEIWDMTVMRRMALKKSFRQFGYPVLKIVSAEDDIRESMLASMYLMKYAGIVAMKGRKPWQALSVLTARQNIFTDPQKPLQVEPKIYEIGKVNELSPILVTTNFSLTYYTVETEVEASKRAAYIVSCEADGMSVLTAWAAEKFTAETINDTLKKSGIGDRVVHKNVIIPGYVAVLSAKLEDASGWNVIVGPREASAIPGFLKNIKN